MQTVGGMKRTEPQEIQTLRWIHAVLGLILVLDGCLGLHAFATAYQEDDLKALATALLSEAQLLAGIWLVAGREPRRTRPWITAIFAGLWASNIYRGIAGYGSSTVFGTIMVGPWIVAVFDLAALACLLKWRPPRGERTPHPPAFLETTTMTATMLGVFIAGIATPALIAVSGQAARRDRPLADAPLTFRRYSVQFDVRTDGQGAFQTPLVRPGRYTVSTPAERRPDTDTLEDRKRVGVGKTDRITKSKAPRNHQVLKQSDDVDNLSLDVLGRSTSNLKIDFQ